MSVVTGRATSSPQTVFSFADASLSGSQLTIQNNLQCSLANGPLLDQMDLCHIKTYSLAAAAQELDLKVLLDPAGGTVAFARIRRLRIRPKTVTDAQTLVLSGGAANPWTSLISNPGTITLRAATPGNAAWVEFVAPSTTGWVVGASNKTLKLDPGASTFDVDVEIYGAAT